MGKIVALFGGQGSQYAGMGKSLYDSFSAAREVYECGSDLLGFDLAQASFAGTDEELTATALCQPAIFAHAMAAFLSARALLPAPEAVAGHSLGEYAALTAAGACSLEDGFRVIAARAAVMEQAAQSAPGAMVAVSGSADLIQEVCARHDRVWAVNLNTPTQTVISGEEAACLAAAEELSAAGLRTTRLAVASAFHTPLMQGAADELKEHIAGIRFATPTLPFYSNLTGDVHTPESFPDYLAAHMVSPVRFVEEVAALTAAGFDTGVEFGPKKTAVTLAKKNNRALVALNVEDEASLNKTAEQLARP